MTPAQKEIIQFFALADDLMKPRSPEEIAYAAEQQHLEEKAEMRARYGVPASDRGRK